MSLSKPNYELYPVLFKKSWNATGLERGIARINRDDLWQEYKTLRQNAPHRSRRAKMKNYLVGHCGKLGTAVKPSVRGRRFEEHLAIALWRLRGRWARPFGGEIRLLDYQVPLKARQCDKGIGKVDLLGIADGDRLVVVEMKVKPASSKYRRNDPMTALMEGLRYSAIIDRNRDTIAKEVRYCWDIEVADMPPIVQILAPKAWWQGWFELKSATRRRTGDWEREFEKLIGDIERQLDIAVECVALDDICRADICYGPDGVEPHIAHAPALYPVRPGEGVIGPALCPHRPGG